MKVEPPPLTQAKNGLVRLPASELCDKGRKLVGALTPALVEAHLLVRLAVGNRPVKHACGVFRSAALVLKRFISTTNEAGCSRHLQCAESARLDAYCFPAGDGRLGSW